MVIETENISDIQLSNLYKLTNGQKPLIGLSGGINSMAVLCQLIRSGSRPAELHLFYAHFKEHSSDTFQFVADGIRLARKHFGNHIVKVKITKNSILEFFEQKKFIPHPYNSYCSYELKIKPINDYAFKHDLRIDLIGYIKEELKRRTGKQSKSIQSDLFSLQKFYPIGDFTDEWCFEIVDQLVGWHPAIYDIRWTEQDFYAGLCKQRQIGQRVFKHNNCLPCKNMEVSDMKNVQRHFMNEHQAAMRLSQKLGLYYGRNEADFYTTFGRDLGQESTCETCKF